MTKNYYQILSIDRNASPSEIKKAYRLLAMKYHPDKNSSPDSQSIFIKITEAYETLIDASKKQEYDYFYDKFIKSTQLTTYEEPIFKEKSNQWEKDGREKATYYSNLSFNDFMKKVFNEAAYHGKYFFNVGCITILFIIGGIWTIIAIPLMLRDGVFDESGGLGILIVIAVAAGLIALGIKVVKNETKDYKDGLKGRKK